MSKIVVTRSVDAPRAQVWEALRDFGTVANFNPHVQTSELLSEHCSGVGAERMCKMYDGNWVKERVLAWEEGRSLTLEIYEGSMPMKEAVAVIALEEAANGTTVTMTMTYELKYGFMGKLLDTVMMNRMMSNMLDQLLGGLGEHVVTGDVIGRGGERIQQAAAK